MLNVPARFLPTSSRLFVTIFGAPKPDFETEPGVEVASFAAVAADDVIAAISRLPSRSSAADPIPTPVLKSVPYQVAPLVTELFNRSLVSGHLPNEFKHAFHTPTVKKTRMMSSHTDQYLERGTHGYSSVHGSSYSMPITSAVGVWTLNGSLIRPDLPSSGRCQTYSKLSTVQTKLRWLFSTYPPR